MLLVAVGALVLAALVTSSAHAASPTLRAGVGRADITPPTGYVLGGWTRADRTGQGVHTRLYASAMVLQRGDQKVALVSVDLFAAPGGMVKEAAERNAARGFSEENVLVQASHTHAGPGGFANFPTYNTVAPSTQTVDRPETFVELLDPPPADRQLYTFLVERIAEAIRQADADLAPAAAGWGEARLTGLTKNRSLEAHLNDHGIVREPGEGDPGEDPEGRIHTIDPEVNVLRVDRLERQRVRCARGRRRGERRCTRTVRMPLGAWSTFANHGTVNPSTYEVYNQDHHGPANRRFEALVRKHERRVLDGDDLVVNVYGNGNAGDQSAGLDGQGPEVAERVGRAEGRAMYAAWRGAEDDLRRRPDLDRRWTRVCFCGQDTESGGPVADSPRVGAPFLTGSEEGRGPLFDVTGVPLEGVRNPAGFDAHGHKAGLPGLTSNDSVPRAVPLMTLRVGSRIIASMPGEPTVEVGRRIRGAVMGEARDDGVERVVVAGYANEFLQYFTTPEEYDRQHYEGASMLYGRMAAALLREQLGELAGRMVRGEPAQAAHPFDPRNGLRADAPPFPGGAAQGSTERQPESTAAPGGMATFGWRGAPRGLDRPLDRAFLVVERRTRAGWRRSADDLGLELVWRVDPEGGYTAHWTVPADAYSGRYRIRVEAQRYVLTSEPFTVLGGRRPTGSAR